MTMVELKSPDGKVSGYLAVPKTGSGPALLVLHAWWGLNDFFKGLCDRLATAGFVAFAPDLYHGATASTRDGAENLMSKLDQKATGREIQSAVRGLQVHAGVRGKRLGVLGFSMGAFWGLWLAQELPADVAAVALFYGTGDGNYSQIRGACLGNFAETDEFESPAVVQDLEKILRTTSGKTSRSTHIPGRRTGFSRRTDLTRMMRRQPGLPGNERFDSSRLNCPGEATRG